jgi:uncharacterized repeat protein (TIGR04138 family)
VYFHPRRDTKKHEGKKIGRRLLKEIRIFFSFFLVLIRVPSWINLLLMASPQRRNQSAMTHFNAKLAEVVRRDSRYAYEAYEFVFQALHHTQQMLDRLPPPHANEAELAAEPKHHVTGKELLQGVRSLAQREFGLMARIVFHMWGIHKTDDFGEIVFNLIEAELMSKTSEDTRADFHNLYNLDHALLEGFRIQLDEAR